MFPALVLAFGGCLMLGLIALAFSGPSQGKAKSRRMDSLKARHSGVGEAAAQAHMRRALTQHDTKLDSFVTRFMPKPDMLRHRLVMTGKTWTLGKYGAVCAGIAAVIFLLLAIKGLPILLALFIGLAAGLGLPHKFVGILIKRRVAKFTAKFPDAIELLVRGLRSGLPITETMTVVGQEVPGPVGVEFRLVGDRVKIGRTLEASLQETADRLNTPEFQFFVITLAIQRETGGNLAETLANLADVLRKRAQMKLKIKRDVVRIEGVGLYHRLAALLRVRHGLVHEPELYDGLLPRHAARDRGLRRADLDGHRRVHHGQDDAASRSEGRKPPMNATAHPSLLGIDATLIATLLAAMATVAVLVAIYAAATVARSDGQARQGAQRAARAAQARHHRLDLASAARSSMRATRRPTGCDRCCSARSRCCRTASSRPRRSS